MICGLKPPKVSVGRAWRVPLYRYLSGLTSRPTPFGLFAGISVGTLADDTRLQLDPAQSWRRTTRLDMHYLCLMAETLSHLPELRRHFRYHPNSSLYPLGGQLRFVEVEIEPKTRELRTDLVSVQRTSYLERALKIARGGTTLDTLTWTLEIAHPEVDGTALEGVPVKSGSL